MLSKLATGFRGFYFALLLLLLSFKPVSPPANSDGLAALNTALNKLADDPAMQHASWGFCVQDPASGKILASFDHNRVLQPASVTKVLSTGAVLLQKGPDYRYETNCYLDGDKLIIAGAGDPSLGSDRFDNTESITEKIAAALKRRGIASLTKVEVSNGLYGSSRLSDGWSWDDIGNYYATEVSAFNFAENQFEIVFESGEPGSPAKLVTQDAGVDISLVNEVVTGPYGSGDQAYVYRGPNARTGYIRGSIPPGKSKFRIKASAPGGTLFYHALNEKLAAAGISPATSFIAHDKPVTGLSNQLTTVSSPTIAALIKATNHRSLNLYADCLMRTAMKQDGKITTLSEDAAALATYWLDLTGGKHDLTLADGSGLSRTNLVSAKRICDILDYLAASKHAATFKASLPTQRVTLDGGEIIAKTGSMTGVKAYAGYYITPSGKPYSFCLVVNNYSVSGGEMRKRCKAILAELDSLN